MRVEVSQGFASPTSVSMPGDLDSISDAFSSFNVTINFVEERYSTKKLYDLLRSISKYYRYPLPSIQPPKSGEMIARFEGLPASVDGQALLTLISQEIERTDLRGSEGFNIETETPTPKVSRRVSKEDAPRLPTPVYSTPQPKKRTHTARYVAIALIILVLVISLVGYQFYQNSQSKDKVFPLTNPTTFATSSAPATSPSTSSAASTRTGSKTAADFDPVNPDFQNGKANITYPENYTILANFALALINKDRAIFGRQQVTLSSIPSGQQHADSMDYYGSWGHWDVQGYKPYMRYTMLGGTGSVYENVAFNYCIDASGIASQQVAPVKCTTATIENSLNSSEWQMMYNDVTCCNNGHRVNILDPMHNRVSIGISYNTTDDVVFLVEDFENNYLNFTTLSASGNTLVMKGSMLGNPNLNPWIQFGSSVASASEIAVYYDNTPSPLSVPTVSCYEQRSQCQAYQQCAFHSENNETPSCILWGGYNSGLSLGEVFGPCPQHYVCSNQLQGGGSAYYAETWQATNSSFDIEFTFSSIAQRYSSGVYTFYLLPSNFSNDTITSYSVFVA